MGSALMIETARDPSCPKVSLRSRPSQGPEKTCNASSHKKKRSMEFLLIDVIDSLSIRCFY